MCHAHHTRPSFLHLGFVEEAKQKQIGIREQRTHPGTETRREIIKGTGFPKTVTCHDVESQFRHQECSQRLRTLYLLLNQHPGEPHECGGVGVLHKGENLSCNATTNDNRQSRARAATVQEAWKQ